MTYLGAAQRVNGVCGEGFADASVRVGSVDGGTGMRNTMPAETSGGVREGVRGLVAAVVGVGVLVAAAGVV